MPEQKELGFEFQDPDNTIPAEARWTAVLAAEKVLQEHGVTLEECTLVGANAYPDYPVGEMPSFVDPQNRIAEAWLAAHDAAWDATGTAENANPSWRLRIVELPVKPLH